MNGAPLPGPDLRRLKALGQKLDPVVHLGKEGLTEALVATVVRALNDHELVKVKLEAWKERKKELAPELARRTESRLIQRVGHVVVLYREHPDPARRKLLGLPRAKAAPPGPVATETAEVGKGPERPDAAE